MATSNRYGGREHGGRPPVYDLYGVVNHSGRMGGGHYYAYVRKAGQPAWRRFDDQRVSELETSAVVSAKVRRRVIATSSPRRRRVTAASSPRHRESRW